ncbi:MAG: MotE family protein [Bdellovibrionales bacterium]
MAPGKNEYKAFFKAAQKIKGPTPSVSKAAFTKKMVKPKMRRSRRPFPVMPLIVLVVGFGGTVWALNNIERIEKWFSSIEIQAMSMASAEGAKSAKVDAKESGGKEKIAQEEGQEKKTANSKSESWTPEQLSFFNKLEEKKKQLDHRESELAKLEEELQQQKVLLEKRLGELDQLRVKISNRLDEKVKVDQEKVDKLVEFYSNMKAQNAAKIFEEIDEDLAIEILGKMKKKSAADIMNLLKPEKAQKLSEKFAGYKKS